ncbi:PREDICTED: HEAT repeat-containing protein 1-like [Priapulus caudatus]|uniref:HEAT repeat-containing protein 1 n=1 Tax=Priapulus caudatus TaxID=37621 RepID=A0ABM1DN98_PRICU|nr:PREDICTED: HEAT repeat-containing protein 1-like [Priapulus caudatus]XP_014661420.1 PREDICTED: HEAT repeat-containing protein 1-like [Priapulus caudatus]
MTSLATQLKRLAVKPQAQVQADHLRSDKQRASLLFDLKEAANLDRDTVYSLGCIGLEELALIDPSFLKFERSIFHSSSKTLERSIQAKDVNHELNRNIANFLVRLSPYFLLKPAHKCLEWLIHRFHIHVYNVDDLMRCVLPYHDANMFVKVVQLLKLDTPRNRWAWLAPLQKAGVPLDKKSLVRYCSKDLGFLSFVCDMVPTALKVYGYKATTTSMRVLFSFYASTIVQTLHSLSKVSNELVAQLVPFLVKGLRSGLKDYTAATYLILSQLAKVATLDQKVVRNLLADVCKGMMANQTMEALGCIVVIFQLQKMKKIPDRVVEKLAEQPQLVAELQLMSEQYDIGEFLSALCCDLLSAALPLLVAPTSMPKEERKLGYKQASRYLKFLIKLVQDVPLGKQVAMTITKCLLTEYCSAHASGKKTARKRLRSRVQPLVRTMEIK